MLQKVLELLNKTGVVYKPAAHSMSANCDLVEEDHGSFKNGPAGKKNSFIRVKVVHQTQLKKSGMLQCSLVTMTC